MRVLIVDDSRAMQVIVSRALDELGFPGIEVNFANDGVEALEIARTWEPELVLTDWHMPKMNGLELLLSLNREMLPMKVGFVTTETSEPKIQEALDAGAMFVVNKPFKVKNLKDAVLPVFEGGDERVDELSHTEVDQEIATRIVLPNVNALGKTLNALIEDTVDIELTTTQAMDESWLPCVIGLFVDSVDRVIHGICVLDMHSSCVLGGAVHGLSAGDVTTAINTHIIPREIFSSLERLFKVISVTMFDRKNECELEFQKMTEVPTNLKQLNVVVNRANTRRLDFEVGIIGLGRGKMVVVTS